MEVPSLYESVILVKVNQLEIYAVLDYNGINAIHKKVLREICEELDDDEMYTYDDVRYIQLDIIIDQRRVDVTFFIAPDLYADMTLGDEFLDSVQAHVHETLKLIRWRFRDELIITETVKNCHKCRALSAGCEDSVKQFSQKVVTESTKNEKSALSVSQELDSDLLKAETSKTKRNRNKKNRKKRKKACNNQPQSSLEGSTSNDSSHENLKPSTSKKEDSHCKFAKIFIANRELTDILSGECLAYYGIYSEDGKMLHFASEILDHKTMLGYHMEAFQYAFDEAQRLNIDNLHIVSEDKYATKLMIDYQETEDVIDRPFGLYYQDEIINYYVTCFAIPGFESIKFEHVSYDDKKYKEMIHLRNLLEDYMDKTPL